MSALGDVAMLCTIMREAALQNPDHQYTFMSRPKHQALLKNMPTNVSFLAFGEHIQWNMYDGILDAHSVWRSWWLDIRALSHGKRIRKIHKPKIRRWLNMLGISVPVPSMLTCYARLFRLKQIPELSFSQEGKRGIGLAPFAAHQGKIFPLEKTESLLAELCQSGEPIYLFGGGEKERTISNEWATKYPNTTSLVGKHTLEEELDIIHSLRVMISMDSANMHLASLVGTRCVSIWGATAPQIGFYGYSQRPEDAIGLNIKCRPCSTYGKKVCRYGDYRCMQGINVSDIISKVQDFRS